MKKYIFLFVVAISLFSCTEDDGVSYQNTATPVTVNFSHNWDGTNVTANEFNTLNYTNAHGETVSLTRLRYLVSKIQLHKADGTSIELKDYNLVDVTNNTNLSFTSASNIPLGNYTMSMVFGFNEADNQINNIPLNTVSWNWPAMLGGGYHFMQMEGKYSTDGGVTQNTYAYHMGTARVSIGNFEPNHFTVNLGVVTIAENQNLEIKMNISEWYKNTYTWDLTQYNNTLMPNYAAQKHMLENGPTVFSLGN